MIIPSGVFTKYFEIADEFINNEFIGKNCKVSYEIQESCPNCNQNTYDGSISSFSNLCPVCNGKTYIITETFEDIRLRIYHSNKDWIKIGNTDKADGKAQIIGFKDDIPKISRANFIYLYSDTGLNLKYKISSDIFPHGFNFKYFIAYIERV